MGWAKYSEDNREIAYERISEMKTEYVFPSHRTNSNNVNKNVSTMSIRTGLVRINSADKTGGKNIDRI